MRLRVDEIELSNVHACKRPVLHPPTLELPFGKIEMKEVHQILGLDTRVRQHRRSRRPS